MAPGTPTVSPEVITQEICDSPFNSKSLVITVGPTKVPFVVHEAKLVDTSFLKVHLSHTNEVRSPQTQRLSNEERLVEVKTEDGSLQRVRNVDPDYHIEDRFFLTPAAFDIFVKHLYNEPPGRPTSYPRFKTLLQAYGIAVNYNCYGLQNKIMDCLRLYYARTKVRLDDLVWTCNRFGDSTECPINAFLVEQIAYEIADGGFMEFVTANSYTISFIEQGDRKIRAALFKAIAEHARNTPASDPATGKNKFHVHENGAHIGQLK